MFVRAEMKQMAKEQLRGRWGGTIGAFVLLYLVLVLLSLLTSVFPYGSILILVLTGPLVIGMILYSIALINTSEKVDVSVVFQGFSIFTPAVTTYLWQVLWTLLWSLLFYIPGIIKGFAYSQCMYIVADNPRIGAKQAMKLSIRMTSGHKWDIFVMYLSFLGWAILATLSLGIGYLWLVPYMQVTYTNMYYKLKAMSIESGACQAGEFEV